MLIAAASIPGVFPPVMIRVEASGQSFDEKHVDGATTASFIAGPKIGGSMDHPLDHPTGDRWTAAEPHITIYVTRLPDNRSVSRNLAETSVRRISLP